ncbi:MAG: hypothetical protein WBB02_12830 [Saprospiraceae bacterium]
MMKNNEMNFDQFLNICGGLKQILTEQNVDFENVKIQAEYHNPYFTKLEVNRMIDLIVKNYLDQDKLKIWISNYQIRNIRSSKKLGIIAAGNIPLVSFHDVLCCLCFGCEIYIKMSTKDSILSKYIYEQINILSGSEHPKISFVERLNDVDALIATGGSLATNHFRTYLEKFPCIIRSHRNSIAVLSGKESVEDLVKLGLDIYSYFGLGCRNVGHLYLPFDYPIENLINILDTHYRYVKENTKYRNNYDYQFALLCLNNKHFLQGESLLWVEDKSLNPPIATINFSYYSNLDMLDSNINSDLNKIQCVASNSFLTSVATTKLGQCHDPELMEYQDGIDTLLFLNNIQE